MAAPAPVGTPVVWVSSAVSATSFDVALPDGIATGEVVFLHVSNWGAAFGLTAPTGWTTIYNDQSNVVRTLLAYRVVDGTEGWGAANNTATVTAASSTRICAASCRVFGADGTTPIAASPAVATGFSNNPDPPSVTFPTTGDYLGLSGFVIQGDSLSPGSVGVPGNWTSLTQGEQLNSPANGQVVAYREMVDAVASTTEDPGSYTSLDIGGGQEWVAWTILVAAGTTPPPPPPPLRAEIAGTSVVWSSSATETSHIVSLPDSIAVGDQVWLHISNRGGSFPVASPVGWVEVHNVTVVARSVLAYRIVDGTEDWGATGNTVEVTATSATRICAISWLVRGGDNTTPLADAPAPASGTSNIPNGPQATAAVSAEYLAISGFAIDGDSITPGNVTPPTGFVSVAQGEQTATNLSGNVVAQMDLDGTTVDPDSFTSLDAASQEWVAWTILLNPGEGEGGGGEPASVGATLGVMPIRMGGSAPLRSYEVGVPIGPAPMLALPPTLDLGAGVVRFVLSGFAPIWALPPTIEAGEVEPPPEPPPIEEPELPAHKVAQRVDWAAVAVRRQPTETGVPTFTEIAPLAFSVMSWTRTLNASDQVSLSVSAVSIPDDLKTMLKQPWATPLELWLFRFGVPIFCGPIWPGTVQGGTVTLNAGGVLDYLRGMAGIADDFGFTAEDQHLIVKGLVDTYQGLAWGNFGISTARIDPSGVLRDRTYLAAEGGVVSELVAQLSAVDNGFDFDVELERTGTAVARYLRTYYPEKGRDLTDVVVLDASVITSSSVTFGAGPDDIASVAVAHGDSPDQLPVRGEVSSPALLASFGRWGAVEVAEGVSTLSTATDHATELLAARDGRIFLPGPGLRSTADVNPVSIDTGDHVLYDYDDGLGQVVMEGRLSQIVTTVDAAGERMGVQIA